MLVIQVTRDSSDSSGRPKRTACEILEVLFSACADADGSAVTSSWSITTML
jgi:hypothetical protein